MLHKVKENKFNFFLFTILGIIILMPFFPGAGEEQAFPFVACLYTIAVIIILWTLLENSLQFILCAALYGGIFALDTVFQYTRNPWRETLDILTGTMHALVFIVLFVKLLHFLFKAKKVSSDHVKGGVAAYFLMGILWGLFYRIALYFDPGAFTFANHREGNLLYFSYVTLATLGYGDIVPASRVTQMMAVMEAMLGQVFLAVFITRLIGLYTDERHHNQKAQEG
jgi:hypothetical protein